MPTRTVELIRHPMRVRTLEVRAITQTGPIYQLITLGGDELADFQDPEPDRPRGHRAAYREWTRPA